MSEVSEVQQALAAYINAEKSAAYWKSMAEEAQRAAIQRNTDYHIALQKREAALVDLIKTAKAAQ